MCDTVLSRAENPHQMPHHTRTTTDAYHPIEDEDGGVSESFMRVVLALLDAFAVSLCPASTAATAAAMSRFNTHDAKAAAVLAFLAMLISTPAAQLPSAPTTLSASTTTSASASTLGLLCMLRSRSDAVAQNTSSALAFAAPVVAMRSGFPAARVICSSEQAMPSIESLTSAIDSSVPTAPTIVA
jgi:hypothetical protein